MASPTARRFGIAWVTLCLSVALHVADEALTDFLSVYNPNALAIRSRIPWMPVPTFTFRVWLASLACAILVALSLSVFAFRGKSWMVPLAYVFGVLMFMNGMSHLLSSVYFQRWMPGVYSSPLLLAASTFLALSARKHKSQLKLRSC